MIALQQISKAGGPRSFAGPATAVLIIIVPLALALICFAARLHVIDLSHTVRAELLFALLLGLMATGMPISIALGLSVLTYLFILSDVDPKMVGLKLFTSIDRFEIMAIPFFILAGNPDRACVQVTLPRHNATRGQESSGSKAKFVSSQ